MPIITVIKMEKCSVEKVSNKTSVEVAKIYLDLGYSVFIDGNKIFVSRYKEDIEKILLG